jgi:hypothetical protein
MSDLSCTACHAPLSAGARYCHRCGRATVAGGAGERTPWIIAWTLVLLAVAGIAYFVLARDRTPARPDMANVGAPGAGGATAGGSRPGTPPDISQMTPADRFLRLSDRVMSAMEKGDTATVLRFAPMALAAYGMLEKPDADLRYHAGVIQAQVGQYPAALALADTIQAEAPGHLFGDMLRAEVARRLDDQAALSRTRRAFLAHLTRQLGSGRPEYEKHREVIEEFRRQAGQ